MTANSVRTVTATRYVTPLREGGSVPAIVEAEDLGTYVLKFRGAAQGTKPLIAELVCGELARALGLPMPEIVFMELDPVLGRSEPDPEIQALIVSSGGLNLALDYLPGSFGLDPLRMPQVEPALASAIVWFDAYVSNVDRTARNTNMLIWHKKIWLIDNGAALYFHYNWTDYLERARAPFPQIRDHVLLHVARDIRQADRELSSRITPDIIHEIVSIIPESWLDGSDFATPEQHRDAYTAYLLRRLESPHAFVEEAIRARSQLV